MKRIIFIVAVFLMFGTISRSQDPERMLPDYAYGTWQYDDMTVTFLPSDTVVVSYEQAGSEHLLKGAIEEYDEERSFLFFKVTTMRSGEYDHSETAVKNKNVWACYIREGDEDGQLRIHYVTRNPTQLGYEKIEHQRFDRLRYDTYTKVR